MIQKFSITKGCSLGLDRGGFGIPLERDGTLVVLGGVDKNFVTWFLFQKDKSYLFIHSKEYKNVLFRIMDCMYMISPKLTRIILQVGEDLMLITSHLPHLDKTSK